MPHPHLCLNAIVKNESGRILRMLDSCKDYISTFAIVDTGSQDTTIHLIEDWSDRNNIPGIVVSDVFQNFSQARNTALAIARGHHATPSTPWFDHLLLVDADMELVVEHPAVFDFLPEQGYHLIQKAGGMSYHNTRLLSIASLAEYRGATHEYLDANIHAMITGAHFIDHADGSNRKDKFARDIALLKGELETQPDDPRTWFYLANSYRDAEQYPDAVNAYRRRVELGGWDEEQFHAQMDLAHALLKQGLEAEFVKEMLKAYQMRPQRAETLYYLANFYRDKPDMQQVGLMFAEQGFTAKRPGDLLFVPDWIYEWGFREEYSILACYNPKTKKQGRRITNELALDLSVPDHVRSLARANMAWYLPKLSESCPSFKTQEINFQPARGYTAMNPSVCAKPNGGLEVILRTVNYKMDAEGRYMIGEKECNDAPIETQNWLLTLGDDLRTQGYEAVYWERPKPKFDKVIGLEDMRLFWYHGERHFSATVREQSAIGQCEQWVGALREEEGFSVVSDARCMSDGVTTQKNWMPVGNTGKFMYDLHTVFETEHSIEITPRTLAVENIRGSSQMIPFRAGWLAVTHEAIYRGGKRVYQHRFVHYPDARFLDQYHLSLPFVFEDVQIEFCAGLAEHPGHNNDLVISYGVRDERAMLATVSAYEISQMLGLSTCA